MRERVPFRPRFVARAENVIGRANDSIRLFRHDVIHVSLVNSRSPHI